MGYHKATIKALIFLNCPFTKKQQLSKDMRTWLRKWSCGKEGAERWPHGHQPFCLWLIILSVW